MPAVTSDILIIGGGIAGVSAGALLAEHAQVHLIEAENQLGTHSTGRSAAMYITSYGPPVVQAMTKLAGPAFHDYQEITDTPLLSPRGELITAREDELHLLNELIAANDVVARLDVEEARRIVPILDESRIVAAGYEADAADIDVDALFQGYIRMFKARGGEISTGCRSSKITKAGDSWRVEAENGSIFEAPLIINAAGAWADVVAEMAGLRPRGIQPKRRSAVLIPPPHGHDISTWPLVASAKEEWYCRPNAGLLMVSPADQDPVPPHDVWPDDMVLAEGIHRFESDTTAKVTRVEHSWAGLRSFAPDGNPVIGFDDEEEGFFWLAGQGGYGIQTSPSNAMLTADLCLGRKPQPDADIIASLSPARC